MRYQGAFFVSLVFRYLRLCDHDHPIADTITGK